jgi:hypothetical protein
MFFLYGSTDGKNPPEMRKTVMFDNAHCETCGNADWTIDGAYSDWARDLRNAGYNVLENKSPLTSAALANVDVLILPEPNTNFSSAEKEAINDFVINKGKGLYVIADHANSDRNHDGWDSVEIFNGYPLGNDSAANEWMGKSFGFRIDEVDKFQDPVTDIRPHAITSGVHKVGIFNGATFTITHSSYAKGVVYLKGNTTNPYVVVSQLPSGGRVLAIGDSSPYNDGTGHTSVAPYDNYSKYNHAQLAVNTVKWLAKDL